MHAPSCLITVFGKLFVAVHGLPALSFGLGVVISNQLVHCVGLGLVFTRTCRRLRGVSE
jgi:hypothetical protein